MKVSKKTGQLRRNYQFKGVVSQLARRLFPRRQRKTVDSVELIIKTQGFMRNTELQTRREVGITAEAVYEE